jgi:hypothetical protein
LNPTTAAQAFDQFQRWGNSSAPPELALFFDAGANLACNVNGMYYGTREEFNTAITGLASGLPTGYTFTTSSVDWIGALQAGAGSAPLNTSLAPLPVCFDLLPLYAVIQLLI